MTKQEHRALFKAAEAAYYRAVDARNAANVAVLKARDVAKACEVAREEAWLVQDTLGATLSQAKD